MADKKYPFAKRGFPVPSFGNRPGTSSSHNPSRPSRPGNPHTRARSENRRDLDSDVDMWSTPQQLRGKPFGSQAELHDHRSPGVGTDTSRRDAKRGFPVPSFGNRPVTPSSHNPPRSSRPESPHSRVRLENRRDLDSDAGTWRTPQQLRGKPFGSQTELRDHRSSGAGTDTSRRDARRYEDHSKQQGPRAQSCGRSRIPHVTDNKTSQAQHSSGKGKLSIYQEMKPRRDILSTRTKSEQNLVEQSRDSGGSGESSKTDCGWPSDPRKSRGFQDRDRQKGFQGQRKLDYRSLGEISLLEPSEIVMKLAAPGSGLREFLDQSEIPHRLVELVLKVLHKAIVCKTSRQNLLHLLGNIQGSAFLKQVLPFYLLGIDKREGTAQPQETLPVIGCIVTLLLELISVFPSSCAVEVSLAETLLQTAVGNLLCNGATVPETTEKKLANLHTFLEHLQKKKRDGTLRSDNYTYLIEDSDLNDFRHISIFPTHGDIYLEQNPIMRPNMISGAYPDAKSYLDTHFRLLREDFIRPLRDGISQLLSLQGKELMRANFDDIRVYFNASIIASLCTRAGIVRQVQFSLKNLKAIRWESSKRLLFGALVCLSKDTFETMLFATVADRNENDLAKGIITLNFTEESRLKLAEMKPDDTFLMVETNAYFEAYHHVLEGLKEMVGNEIPLQKYIVHCEADISAPAYLTRNRTGYSLQTLVANQSLALKHVPDSDSSDDKNDSEDDIRNQGTGTQEGDSGAELETVMERLLGNLYISHHDPRPSHSTTVPPSTGFDVINFRSWPSREKLQLDRSQLKAFQMSLTKELSIIQGPPGTGKTYVGLKIVKALLANAKIWNPTGHRPILVVCYTNHALDQFLEGIHTFLKGGIVRVGSRSNSEIMKTCNLSSLRNSRHVAQAVPGHLRAMFAELNDERMHIQLKIEHESAFLKVAVSGILQQNVLEKYISIQHKRSLQSAKESMELWGSVLQESDLIFEWLGVSVLCKTSKNSARLPAPNEQKAMGETLLAEFLQQEKSMEEHAVSMEADISDEEGSDLITVAEEAELLQAERMMEDDDVKKQILEARARAARKEKEILSCAQLHLHDEDYDDGHEGMGDDGSWEITKQMKKNLKDLIKQELKKTQHMDENRSEEVRDLWQLPFPQRWELYRLWRNKYLTDVHHKVFTLENEYQQVINRQNELRNQEDLLILRKAHIIGMTTTGAAKYRKVLQDIRPKIVVVEEAAEVLEAHIMTALSTDCEQLILIGDHQQLRPSATVYELATNFNLEVSMFERLVKMNVQYVRLDYQHRMRPEIAQLLTPHIYDKLENHPCVYGYDRVKGVAANLFFVEHDQLEEHIAEGKSHQNVHEAAFVKSLCRYFLCQGYEPSQITVLTTYSGQLFCLKNLMPKAQFGGVRVCVVDKYQGEENEIIILSLVRSNPEGRAGFLQIPNRICVALSRAKQGLFCIGNMQMLSKVPLWANIINVLKANGQIGKELKLCCENHPNNVCYVSKAEDFASVPEGGCMEPCDYRLACGHVCTLPCHPYDPEHTKFSCMKPCPKVLCEAGHRCRKSCFEPCGSCLELVKKEIPKCGHVQEVRCSVDPCSFICQNPCPIMLSCGHKCVRHCGDFCTRNCPERIAVELECGHSASVLCHIQKEAEQSGKKIICFEKCPAVLECGHCCRGSCSECSQGRWHVACTKPCDRALICSHLCADICSTDCFCCLRTCENKCFHSKCEAKCSDPCPPCTKPCGWRCKHAACTKRCWEPCDREPCDMPCYKKLKCNHPCIGLCGEPCPQKCRQCNAEEVNEIFFGKEADPESRFVQLRECPHIFEVSEFTKWMNQQENDGIVKLKTCPKCLVPIRQNIRYGSIIKETLSDIEKVKRKIVQTWVYQLEEFLNENENVLNYFPWTNKTLNILMDPNNTVRSLLLIGEKLNLLSKMGNIKKKAEQLSLQHQLYVNAEIKSLSEWIENTKSNWAIRKEKNALLRMALLTEGWWGGKLLSGVSALNIERLTNELWQHKEIDQGELQKMHENIKASCPFQLELVILVQNKKNILDTELLQQDQWRKCFDGHIYNSQKLGIKTSVCPQCSIALQDQVEEESME